MIWGLEYNHSRMLLMKNGRTEKRTKQYISIVNVFGFAKFAATGCWQER